MGKQYNKIESAHAVHVTWTDSKKEPMKPKAQRKNKR